MPVKAPTTVPDGARSWTKEIGMEIERMELVGLEVADLDAAMEEFGSLLGVEFVRVDLTGSGVVEHLPADEPIPDQEVSMSVAIDRTGYLELIQTFPPTTRERVRNIHFKVADIDAAIAHMRDHGHRLVSNVRIGSMREAVFGAKEARGLRMCLVQYDTPSMVEAMLQRPYV